MKVFGLGERLAEERGTADFAVLDDEAAVGFVVEQGLADAGDDAGVNESGDDGEKGGHAERGKKLVEHGKSLSLCQVKKDQELVDEPDAGERHQNAAQTVDEDVAAQQGAGAHRAIFHAAQGERHERDDDERVKDDGREHGGLRRVQAHNIEAAQHRISGHKHGRDDGEVFGHVVGNGKGGERAARDQQLFADGHHFNQLGGIAVEVHHVAY